MSSDSLFSQLKPVLDFVQYLLELLSAFLLSLLYNGRGLDALTGNIHPIANDSNFTVTQ
jgi:hypothetical protein